MSVIRLLYEHELDISTPPAFIDSNPPSKLKWLKTAFVFLPVTGRKTGVAHMIMHNLYAGSEIIPNKTVVASSDTQIKVSMIDHGEWLLDLAKPLLVFKSAYDIS